MLDRNQHKIIISKILFEIYQDKELAPALAFKGGTACFFFYNLPRFSTDLDFNLIDSMMGDVVYGKIVKIIQEYGTIKDQKNKLNTIYLLLAYNDGGHNIKIEISKRTSKFDKYEIKHYLGLPVLTMTKECSFAHKLCAITDRNRLATRDLFDAWFMLKSDWKPNEDIIKARTGKNKNDYFADLVVFLEKDPNINILHGLGEVLDREDKIWAKSKLLPELIYLLKLSSS